MAGQIAGKLDVPADYKDIFQSHFDARRLLSQPESGDYYSFSRAHPIQYADEEWLNRLMEKRLADERRIKEGSYKKGGKVDISAADRRLSQAIANRMAKGGGVDIKSADARLQAAIDARMGMADGGEAGFKKIQFMADGGKLVKGGAKVMKKLFADEAPAVNRDANLQKFLSKSQVKDPVFHASKADVKQFSPKHRTGVSSMGHHFGTAEQANFRTGQYDFDSQTPNIGKYHLNIENPLEVSHMASFAPDHLAEQLMDMNLLKPETYDALSAKHNYDNIAIGDELVKVLRKNGYDGLKYANEREGEGFSYVPLNPTQIKSAIGNRGTYDVNEPDITKAEGGGAFKKLEFMADGGKLVKGAAKIGKRLLSNQEETSQAIGKAAESAGMKAPQTAEKSLVTLQDYHTSLGDAVRARAMEAQKQMDAWNYKYAPGQYVFTEHGAKNNLPPLKILEKSRHGWNIVREDPNNLLSKKVIDPETGKAMRTPYEPGYRVRRENGDDWSEFIIPESIIKGDVEMANGGGAFKKLQFMADGGKLVKGISKVGKKLLAEPEKKIIEPPSIIIPSKVSNVKDAMRKRQGEYGARRVERAADEVPNLERMYQEEALKQAFGGDNAKAMMTINPKDFEKYAMPLPMNLASDKAYFKAEARNPTMREAFMDSGLTNEQWHELNDIQKMDVFNKYNNKVSKMAINEPMEFDQYLKHLADLDDGFEDVPFLQINKQEQGLPLTPFISGHEGRHRNRALAGRGEEKSLVQLIPRAELREPFPRRSQEEYLEALKKEMEMTGNKVRPEDEDVYGGGQIQQIRRGLIELPDLYADGGAAFKTLQFKDAQHFDGGGIAIPEMNNSFEGSSREPLLTEKDWANIKRNAPEVYEWAKQNVKDEASQLKTARGVRDFALRTGAQYLGGIPDLVNLGLMGVDALADTNLSSEKPWFGSEQYIDALKRSGAIGENEFPIAETVAGVLAPAGLIKKGVKQLRKPRSKQEPKKRRGGLTAMSR
jgi:hypothetical protein